MSKLPNALDMNYICNPETGRWVMKNGKIGQTLLSEYGTKSLESYSRFVEEKAVEIEKETTDCYTRY